MAENKEIAFEYALSRLEEIVKALENGKEPLDTALKLFEEGVSLVTVCKERLDNAEQRVKLLMGNGTDDEKDLDGTDL